jgi:hypothetical protein
VSFIIPSGELPETRPALWLPERDGYRAEWLQNVPIYNLWYWATRNEWEASVLRKSYTKRMYDAGYVMLREPRATEHHATEDLIALGLLGVYGWRRM